MRLEALDWAFVIAYFVASTAIVVALAGRARRSLADFFLSGRSLPWWLAGTSMVATTFAVDTPLAVTGMVARHGVAGNWLWWNMALSGLLTVFLFSRLWRRAGVTTDVELTELRYSGKPAAFLRGARALYLALPINLIIMGWVTRAMVTVLEVTLGIAGWTAAIILFAITAAYAMLSGLWGVVLADLLQFTVAMIGSIALAIVAVRSVGGLDGLSAQAAEHFGSVDAAFAVLPPVDAAWLPLSTLLVFLAVQWWAAWYPGAEPGGGGYIAQRMFSTKNERHSLLATLWFNVAHYAIRPWPWILVAFVSVIRYPDLQNPEEGYVRVMVDLLPSPLRGLLLAAFAAAYMSTISTHLNWGASYLVNDVYLRFIRRRAGDREQVVVSRSATLVLMAFALVTMGFLGSVEAGWKLLLAVGAGTGMVLILRWYWWRVNAWSELSAMVASFITSVTIQYGLGLDAADPTGRGYASIMLWTVSITTVVWLTVTWLTPAVDPETLDAFYRRVRPGGPGWKPVAKRLGFAGDSIPGGVLSIVNWVAGCVAIYGTLFAVGQLLLGSPIGAAASATVGAAAFLLIARNLRADPSLADGRVDTDTRTA